MTAIEIEHTMPYGYTARVEDRGERGHAVYWRRDDGAEFGILWFWDAREAASVAARITEHMAYRRATHHAEPLFWARGAHTLPIT